MIFFPVFKNQSIKVRKIPATWFLLYINITIFLVFLSQSFPSQNQLSNLAKDTVFIDTQGRIYAEFIQRNSLAYSDFLNQVSGFVLNSHSPDKVDLLGRMAFRDSLFIQKAHHYNYSGDQVTVERWRLKVQGFLNEKDKNLNFRFGLSWFHHDLPNWFSYQFLHGGFTHLLVNMWFLLVLGSYIEPLIGTFLFSVIYLSSGLIGACVFTLFSGISAIPLVGASGAISGLMGMFAVFYWKKPIKCIYLVLPKKSYWGYASIPTWILFSVWLISDLAGYLGSFKELPGIAHTAHLGGIGSGLIMGSVILWLTGRNLNRSQSFSEDINEKAA